MKMKPNSIFAMLLLIFIVGNVDISLALENSSNLQQKMAEISLLQSQLNERRGEAIKIREQLYSHLSEYRSEIKAITTQEKIINFNAAEKYPRIRNNLQLCGEIVYYIEQVNQKIRFYQIGQDKLDYLYQQADDDLKIINALTNLKVEALLAQIDSVILDYLPEAHRILIDFDTAMIVDLETIWKKVTQK